MMPHEDHMMLDQFPPHMGHMIPDRDHMMTDEDNAIADEDHVMPNNLNSHMMRNDNDDHSVDHISPHMGAAMAHMMPHQNQVSY